MWTVAKIKINEITTFKRELIKKIGNETIFYIPEVKTQSFKKNRLKDNEQYVLEDYIFCYNKKFENLKIFHFLKFTKGLKYFLQGSINEQKSIKNFVEYCKLYEDDIGFLKYSFFNKIEKNYIKFISGPFTNMIFKVLNKNKNKLKVLIGDMSISVNSDKDYVFAENV